MADTKLVYRAATRELAGMELENLAGKWGSKYPVVIRSGRNSREKLTTCFQYIAPMRKLIYATNAVEGYHRQIRKVTKTRGAFTSDVALLKLVHWATRNIEKKWTGPLPNRSLTVQQLAIKFGGRLPLDLEHIPLEGHAPPKE